MFIVKLVGKADLTSTFLNIRKELISKSNLDVYNCQFLVTKQRRRLVMVIDKAMNRYGIETDRVRDE